MSLGDLAALGVLEGAGGAALPLSQRDHTRIRRLLEGPIGRNDPLVARELRAFLQLHCKAEVEALQRVKPEYLTATYITRKRQQIADQAAQREAAAQGGAELAGAQPAAAPAAGVALPAAAAVPQPLAASAAAQPPWWVRAGSEAAEEEAEAEDAFSEDALVLGEDGRECAAFSSHAADLSDWFD